MVANRDEHGRFLKGAPSPNPRGRPLGLAERVRALTHDCQDQVIFYQQVFEGKHGAKLAHRMEAAAWLVDRGYGKAVQINEHAGEGGGPLLIEYVNDWRGVRDKD